MAVVLLIIMHPLSVFALSPPGTTQGPGFAIPTLKPVGHQSTKLIVPCLDLIVAMLELTSLGTTLPLYIKQQAMYFPLLGSHYSIMLIGSNTAVVICAVVNFSWTAFSGEQKGE